MAESESECQKAFVCVVSRECSRVAIQRTAEWGMMHDD